MLRRARLLLLLLLLLLFIFLFFFCFAGGGLLSFLEIPQRNQGLLELISKVGLSADREASMLANDRSVSA